MSVRVDVTRFATTDLPERKPGEHLWVVLAAFRVKPDSPQMQLDAENILTIGGPGCFWCEEKWTPEIGAEPCR